MRWGLNREGDDKIARRVHDSLQAHRREKLEEDVEQVELWQAPEPERGADGISQVNP